MGTTCVALVASVEPKNHYLLSVPTKDAGKENFQTAPATMKIMPVIMDFNK